MKGIVRLLRYPQDRDRYRRNPNVKIVRKGSHKSEIKREREREREKKKREGGSVRNFFATLNPPFGAVWLS